MIRLDRKYLHEYSQWENYLSFRFRIITSKNGFFFFIICIIMKKTNNTFIFVASLSLLFLFFMVVLSYKEGFRSYGDNCGSRIYNWRTTGYEDWNCDYGDCVGGKCRQMKSPQGGQCDTHNSGLLYGNFNCDTSVLPVLKCASNNTCQPDPS